MTWRTLALFAALATGACVTGAGGPSLPPPVQPLCATPEQPFRREPPSPADPPPYEAPEIVVSELPNGLTVVLLRRRDSPAATITVATRLGGEDGPLRSAGVAWFLGEVLTAGASGEAPWDSHPFERRGMTPDVRVGRDRARLTVQMPGHRLEEMLPLVARVVTAPTLPPEEVEEARRGALSRITGIQRTPADRAWYHARRMLHGEGHRRATPVYGSVDVLRGVTREELLGVHRRTWVPSESVLVVAGDITSERLVQLATESFGSWSNPADAPTEPPPAPTLAHPWTGPRLLAVPSRSHSSTIMVLEHGPSRLDDAFADYSLLAGVIGGIFASRLNLALREERGYSYGVTASFGSDRYGGELAIQTVVAQDRVRESVLAIVAEMGRLRDAGPTEEELESARALMRESLVGDLEVTSSASVLLADVVIDQGGPEDLIRLERRIRAVTVEDVRAAARRWLRPDAAPIVVTGRLPLIEAALQSTGLGPVMIEGDR